MSKNGPVTAAREVTPALIPAADDSCSDEIRGRILESVTAVRVLDPDAARAYVRTRQAREVDKYDEVWDGVYVVPPLATNPHQGFIGVLCHVFYGVMGLESGVRIYPGANVSDRRSGWEHSYRCPDVVAVLPGGRAVDCGTHWMGGPDFLVEVESPRDATGEKIPFYGRLGVRELLVIGRDTRRLRLYRHDGTQLVEVGLTVHQGKKWLVSEVIPFAFRRTSVRGDARTVVRRTDGTPGEWVI